MQHLSGVFKVMDNTLCEAQYEARLIAATL